MLGANLYFLRYILFLFSKYDSLKAISFFSMFTNIGTATLAAFEFIGKHASAFGVILGMLTFLMNLWFQNRKLELAAKARENLDDIIT